MRTVVQLSNALDPMIQFEPGIIFLDIQSHSRLATSDAFSKYLFLVSMNVWFVCFHIVLTGHKYRDFEILHNSFFASHFLRDGLSRKKITV